MSTLLLTLGPVTDDYYETTRAAVPVEVLDQDGTLVAETSVTAREARTLELPTDTVGPVFVRARLPSGEQHTKRVDLDVDGSLQIPVMLFDQYVSPHEWLAWSRPHIRIDQLRSLSITLKDFGNVWTKLWRRNEGKWLTVTIAPTKVEQDTYAGQLELQLDEAGYLLQIGGDRLPWRFISLPGGGPVRVLLTPNTSRDPRADPLRVTVSRMKPDEETLLAYLLRDRLQEADVLSGAPHLAERLLRDKYDDAVSACIGAYFLLRVDRLSQRLYWAENLYRSFDWLADGAVILASQLLRNERPLLERIDHLLDEALERGLPIYLEGLRLLNHACQIMAS